MKSLEIRHVALVIQHYPPYLGGAERQACLFAEALVRRGIEVTVLTTRFDRDLDAKSKVEGVVIERLPTFKPRFLKLFSNLIVGFAAGFRAAAKVDLIHGHCLSPFVFGALLAAKFRSCPNLIKICSTGSWGDIEKIRRFHFGPLLWLVFRKTDCFVAPTKAVGDELMEHGVDDRRLCIVPNLLVGSPRENAEQAEKSRHRKKLGLSDRLTLLYVGRLSPEKGLDRLMRIWPQIVIDNDVQLLLVGEGPQRLEITRWCLQNNLEDSIKLLGFQPDPDPFYRAADIFVFPSRSETFGNVIVEAMQHGLVVATTPVGVVKQWPDDTPIVRLDPGDSTTWISTMKDIIENIDAKRGLGNQAADFVTSRYGEEMVCQKYLSLYKDLIQA